MVVHNGSGEIENSAADNKWDVAFLPVDEERKKFVDFGNAYHLLQSTYLVGPAPKIASVAAANAAGVRIGGVADTATFRTANKTAPNAAHVTFDKTDDAIAAMSDGEIDAMALSRESLTGVAPKTPGSRILDGGFLNSTTSVAVPKGRPQALAYVTVFIEEAEDLRLGAPGLRRNGADVITRRAGGDEVLRPRLRRADMLRPHAEADHPRRNPPQHREPVEEPGRERRLRPRGT